MVIRLVAMQERGGAVDTARMAVVGLGYNAAEQIGIRWLGTHQQEIAQSIERLASGKRINRASDDPSGLTASESLKGDQRRVLAKIKANQDSDLRYSAIDGGLSVVSELLTDLNSDVVTAANSAGLSDTEKQANQLDVNSIVDTLNHLALTTVYRSETILAPYIGAAANTYTSGPNGTQSQNVAGALSQLREGGALNLINGDLEGAQKLVGDLLSGITSTQAAIGATQQGLQKETNALMVQNENLSSAISQIVDTDYASEVGNLVRSQALASAATYAIQAARDLQAQTVLDLIKSQPLPGKGLGLKQTL